MLTRNVHYAEQPDPVIIYHNGQDATVEFPLDVNSITVEDEYGERTEYIAGEVYSFYTKYTADLETRISDNYEAWLEKAKEIEPQKASLEDVIEAVNALAEIIIGE